METGGISSIHKASMEELLQQKAKAETALRRASKERVRDITKRVLQKMVGDYNLSATR